MNVDVIKLLTRELALFGPSLQSPYTRRPGKPAHLDTIFISLNRRVSIFIDYLTESGDLEICLDTGGRDERVWVCPLADPQSIDKLISFLRELPLMLAKIDPLIWAVND